VRDRVVFADFDAPVPVAYNPFKDAPPEDYGRLTGDFLQTIGPLFGTEGFRQLEYFLRNGVYALFALGLNLAKLLVLFSPSNEGDSLRASIVRTVQHEAVLRFWRDEYRTIAASKFAPINNRVAGLFLDDRTFRTFNQQENKVDVGAVLRDHKVLIVALPSEWEAARIVGGFIIGQVKHLAMRRTVQEQKFFLIAEEAHRFEGSAFWEVIDQTTKGRLSLWLSHQNMGHIPAELKKPLQSIDTFLLRINKDDSRHYASLLRDKVTPETLTNLPQGECYARIGGDIVNFQCPPPLIPDPLVAAEIIAASRARYYQDGTVSSPVVPHRSRIIETFE